MVRTCTVYGLILDSHGEPRPGTRVRFEPLIDVASTADLSALIVYRGVEVVTDSNGHVPPTALVASDVTGEVVPWRVVLRAAGTSQSWEFLADTELLNLATVPQLPSPGTGVEQWVAFAGRIDLAADRAEAAALRAEQAGGGEGSVGPKGDTGDTGPAGPKGDGFFTKAPPTWSIPPNGVLSAIAGTHTPGRFLTIPTDVPTASTIGELFYRVDTAAVGGSVRMQAALFPSDVDGWPILASPLWTGDLELGSVGSKVLTLPTPLALPAGRYWTATQYFQTTAPTTAPKLISASNVTLNIPTPPGVIPGETMRGYRINTATWPTSSAGVAWTISGSTEVVMIGLRVTA